MLFGQAVVKPVAPGLVELREALNGQSSLIGNWQLAIGNLPHPVRDCNATSAQLYQCFLVLTPQTLLSCCQLVLGARVGHVHHLLP